MRVFVSYRREDSSAYAGRLRDSLVNRLGARNVFQDVSTIAPGEDFRRAITGSLDIADAALVVIGPGWLTASGADGVRRLEQSTDYVRAEITEALDRDMRVVPVLVGGAPLPAAGELPDVLQPLAERQAVVIHDATWHDDVDGWCAHCAMEEPRGRRRWWLVAVAVAALAVAGIVLALALRDAGEPGTAGNDTTFPTSVGPCPDTDLSAWTTLEIRNDAVTDLPTPGGSWTFEVTGAGHRAGEHEWDMLLAVSATNETGDVHYQLPNYYALAIDGVQYETKCISVIAGADPLGDGAANDVHLGFTVNRDPTASDVVLDLDVPGGTGSVALSPVP